MLYSCLVVNVLAKQCPGVVAIWGWGSHWGNVLEPNHETTDRVGPDHFVVDVVDEGSMKSWPLLTMSGIMYARTQCQIAVLERLGGEVEQPMRGADH